MSLTVGELQVLLSGDPSKLNRELDRIDSRAGQTEKAHSAAWTRIGAVAGAAIRSGMVVATGAVLGLGAAIKQGLNMSAFTEQAQISFTTLLGSADKAKTYLGDLQKFAAATPFELPGVVEGAQKLLGVGAAAETVIPTLTAWGDASGALGLTQDQFGRTLTAVTQMMGKGKVSAEEMLQITEAGIPIWMLLAKATGKPVPELQKLASEGKLLADDVLPALEAQMNKDYGGSMAKQATTLNGVWSTAKDNMNLALRDAVQPLAEGLKVVLPDASVAAANAIRELGLRGSTALVELIKRGQELREQFGPELGELGEIAAQKWGQFTKLLGELGSAVAPSLPALIEALVRIAKVGGEVSQAMLPALEAGLRLAGPAAGMLSGALTVVADVLETIEPILPLVVGGFLAFRTISGVAGIVRTIAGHLDVAAVSMQKFAVQSQVATTAMTGSVGAGQRVGSTISAIGKSLPLLAIATAGISVAFAKGAEELNHFGDMAESAYARLAQGGHVADQARQELTALQETSEKVGNGFGTFGSGLSDELEKARLATNRAREAMTPLQTAQEAVTRASNNLQVAQETYGVGSEEAAAKTRILVTAQETLEQKQRNLDNATRTATQALLEQTQAAMAGANADLAASMAATQLADAQAQYNASLADGTLTATQHQQATDAMTQSAFSAAQAAAAQAAAHSTATSEEGKQRDADAALLASLQATAQQLGANTPAAITNLIGSLQNSAGAATVTSAQMRDLGLSVQEIPGQKAVVIDAPTADQKKRLSDLGLTVTNIPGSKQVVVSADTGSAQTALDEFVRQRRVITIQTNYAQGGPLNGPARRDFARGGIVHAYAGGGVEPMRGGIAQIVPPNTWRIIGDRVKDDEAYIPINRDARSLSILSHAARRMGGQFVPTSRPGSAGTGSASVGSVTQKHYHLNAAVRQEITPREFVNLQQEADALYG